MSVSIRKLARSGRLAPRAKCLYVAKGPAVNPKGTLALATAIAAPMQASFSGALCPRGRLRTGQALSGRVQRLFLVVGNGRRGTWSASCSRAKRGGAAASVAGFFDPASSTSWSMLDATNRAKGLMFPLALASSSAFMYSVRRANSITVHG